MKFSALGITILFTILMFGAVAISVYWLSVGSMLLALVWAFNTWFYGVAVAVTLRSYAIHAGFTKRD